MIVGSSSSHGCILSQPGSFTVIRATMTAIFGSFDLQPAPQGAVGGAARANQWLYCMKFI
jgi:hypothetical protein